MYLFLQTIYIYILKKGISDRSKVKIILVNARIKLCYGSKWTLHKYYSRDLKLVLSLLVNGYVLLA